MSHTLKDIAVFFDTSPSGLNVLEIAARLAGEQRAHLIGISAVAEDGTIIEDGFARGKAVHEVAEQKQHLVAARLSQVRHALAAAAARHGVNEEFRVVPYTQSGGEAALHALYCDLLVVGSPAVGAPLSWSAVQVLQCTGMPLLIVPAGWNSTIVGRRIAVAWNASRPARRALDDALPLMTAAESVDVLIVDPQRGSRRHGEEPGADIASYLARHEVSVEVRRMDSQGEPVAEILLREAAEHGADLVVFGAYSSSRVSEAIFGGVTRTLLESDRLPLLVSH